MRARVRREVDGALPGPALLRRHDAHVQEAAGHNLGKQDAVRSDPTEACGVHHQAGRGPSQDGHGPRIKGMVLEGHARICDAGGVGREHRIVLAVRIEGQLLRFPVRQQLHIHLPVTHEILSAAEEGHHASIQGKRGGGGRVIKVSKLDVLVGRCHRPARSAETPGQTGGGQGARAAYRARRRIRGAAGTAGRPLPGASKPSAAERSRTISPADW